MPTIPASSSIAAAKKREEAPIQYRWLSSNQSSRAPSRLASLVDADAETEDTWRKVLPTQHLIIVANAVLDVDKIVTRLSQGETTHSSAWDQNCPILAVLLELWKYTTSNSPPGSSGFVSLQKHAGYHLLWESDGGDANRVRFIDARKQNIPSLLRLEAALRVPLTEQLATTLAATEWKWMTDIQAGSAGAVSEARGRQIFASNLLRFYFEGRPTPVMEFVLGQICQRS